MPQRARAFLYALALWPADVKEKHPSGKMDFSTSHTHTHKKSRPIREIKRLTICRWKERLDRATGHTTPRGQARPWPAFFPGTRPSNAQPRRARSGSRAPPRRFSFRFRGHLDQRPRRTAATDATISAAEPITRTLRGLNSGPARTGCGRRWVFGRRRSPGRHGGRATRPWTPRARSRRATARRPPRTPRRQTRHVL